MTDDEIIQVAISGNSGTIGFARAIIAAYQAKLLAGVEIPEPYGELSNGYREFHGIRKKGYTKDQLQQYAAACAAQARVKALEQAMQAFSDCCAFNGVSVQAEAHVRQFIEKLKGGE